MTPPSAESIRHLLYDWAHDSGGRLALWLVFAVALHAGVHVLFEVRYPRPQPPQISEATLYVLPPGSAQAREIAPYLAAADPALFAPDRSGALQLPEPTGPAYRPSYAAAAPALAPMPEDTAPVLPPLPTRARPVPMPVEADALPAPPAPREATQLAYSAALRRRAPESPPRLPEDFVARPGDQLAPTTFLVAVDAEGRVRHRLLEGRTQNAALEDAASRFLGALRFAPAPDQPLVWGTVTMHWGLDLERRELE